jgi:beta-lactamase regulating signal transducer with metallopeptidase domain
MTADLDTIMGLAWSQFWQVTLVAVALGAIARLLGRNLPRFAYALWMLVVIKAIVPPVVSSPTGVFSWVLATEAGRIQAPPRATVRAALASGSERLSFVSSLSNQPGLSKGPAIGQPRILSRIPMILGLVWLAGLTARVVLMVRGWIVGRRCIGHAPSAGNSDLAGRVENLAHRLGIKRPVRLLITESLIGPAAFGVLRPTMVLPAPLLCNLDAYQLELIMAHELIHLRRGDVIVSYLQGLAHLLWWFHPLVWWANREASRQRELCCDEDVVSGLGCPPARYARTLLEVLHWKRQLRPLSSLLGMQPVEITLRRLEHIMRYRNPRPSRSSLFRRLVFAAGLILIIPGAGLVRQGSQPPANGQVETKAVFGQTAREEWTKALKEWEKFDSPKFDQGHKNVFDQWSRRFQKGRVTAKPIETMTLNGTVRDKATGKPLPRIQVSESNAGIMTITDEDGHFTLSKLAVRERYELVALPVAGQPYLITSKLISVAKGEQPKAIDLELVAGIPFRIKILDTANKPARGALNYFPVHPNNPFERGVMGYAADGRSMGAFYEALADGHTGEFYGAVLPGPGILCFTRPDVNDRQKAGRGEPLIFTPDGKDAVRLLRGSEPKSLIAMVPISAGTDAKSVLAPAGGPVYGGLGLLPYDAIIAISPKEGTRQIVHEIRLEPSKDY